MNVPYSASTIAKYLIKKSKESGVKNLTNLKLQKLLYYAQGWHLGIFKNKLFNDKIEAWKLGPAVRNVYQEYKDWGNKPIDKMVSEEDVATINEQTKKFLDEVWNVYKNTSGAELVTYTHLEKPWKEAWEHKDNTEYGDYEITADSLKEYFEGKLKNDNKN